MRPRRGRRGQPERESSQPSCGRRCQKASEATRELAGELIKTTLAEVGKRFSETPRSEAEITRHADGLADMFCAYLDELARRESQS
jgi:hypothetical protein